MTVDSFPDRTITIKDKEYLYFGGTSYLGMATLPEFQNLIFNNIKKWGTFYGSSRNANVKLSVYDKAEQLLSEQIGSEASATVSSGALAGKLTTEYLSKTIDTFFHYPKTHPAILVEHSLPLFVKGKLHPKLQDDIVEEVVIAVDAILSLEVTPTSFDFLDRISSKKKITLIVDESHSLGIVGKNGQGIFNSISNEKLNRKIMISSLGKALGLSGGIIASDKLFIDALKSESVFVSSSGANPAYLEAYVQAQDLYNEQRQKLRLNLDFLTAQLHPNKTLKFNSDYPVIYSNDSTIFTTLLKNGMVITNFKYPTYKSPMNRIVITANHTQKDLEILSLALSKGEGI
ncbi:MAG: aminotransferase class I/II-fold pyridoxal phosphate-dependent enzyme [Flavobacteriaceae bacterium]|nr:aminotransferase class I/II-fold pyridoxal phosphate-dependent enzyme [Flavobacteriaceae bacterium]